MPLYVKKRFITCLVVLTLERGNDFMHLRCSKITGSVHNGLLGLTANSAV